MQGCHFSNPTNRAGFFWKVALEKFDLVLLEASEEHPEHDEASYWSSLLEQEE